MLVFSYSKNIETEMKKVFFLNGKGIFYCTFLYFSSPCVILNFLAFSRKISCIILGSKNHWGIFSFIVVPSIQKKYKRQKREGGTDRDIESKITFSKLVLIDESTLKYVVKISSGFL